MRALTCFLLVLGGGAMRASAQAPHVTPAGDPSVRSDSIYRLAVNPVDHPDEGYVILLDDGVVTVEADGRSTRTYRQVVQVLTRETAERWGEQSFSYDSSRERLTLNWARVLSLDGQVISAQPSHEQESTVPVAASAPVYSDIHVHRITLAGVQPGTLVDYSYTVETMQPIMPGDFLNTWIVTTGAFTRRSRYIVDAPMSLALRIRERNLDFQRQTTVAHGRRVYTWATKDVPKVEAEPFAADSNAVVASVRVGAPVSWADIGRWYATLARDRYQAGPALDSEIARVVSPGRSLEDTLRLLHRWVAQDFRYVSLSLGIGGYRPRLPDSVYADMYGDCKDKATLFIAAARRLGVHADPVVLDAGGRVDRDLPSVAAFDHMIAAIDLHGARTYADLTAPLVPFGLLPAVDQDEFGLLIHPDGSTEEVVLPEDSVGANATRLLVEGDLSPDGQLSAHMVVTASGAAQSALREAFEEPRTALERREAARVIADKVLPGATGDSLVGFDGRDLQAAARLALVIHVDRAVTRAGDRDILTLPFGDATASLAASALEARGPRRFPIDVAKVIGPRESVSELRLVLPDGWKVDVPPSDSVTSAFGMYASRYSQEGNVLRVVRRVRGAQGIEPPSRIGDLVSWLKSRAAGEVKYVVVRHS